MPNQKRFHNPIKEHARYLARKKFGPAKKHKCIDCGKVAFGWDHYKGYEFPLDVEPVCISCHNVRSFKRGEMGGFAITLKGLSQAKSDDFDTNYSEDVQVHDDLENAPKRLVLMRELNRINTD